MFVSHAAPVIISREAKQYVIIKNIYIFRKPFCFYCFSSDFSVFAYFIAADDEKLSPPRFTPKKSARNFLSICLFLILNPRAMRVHARCSGAGGFANPPDASRQYCHVPAVSLLSGYFRGKKKQLFHIWKFGFNETQPWWFIRGSNPEPSQHQHLSPTKAPC